MTAFEDFVNRELPNRPVLLLSGDVGGYTGDPNDAAAPSIIQNSPKGTFYFEDTTEKLWRKLSVAPGTWQDFGASPSSSLVSFDTQVVDRLYVGGPGSSDLNPGTQTQPFATIQAAIDKAAVLQAADPSGTVIIVIHSGDYSTENLVFNDSAFRRIKLIAHYGSGLGIFQASIGSFTCTQNNDNFYSLSLENIRIKGDLNLLGVSDLTSFMFDGFRHINGNIYNSISLTNMGSATFINTTISPGGGAGTWTNTNVAGILFTNSSIAAGGNSPVLFEWDGNSNQPLRSGVTPYTNMQFQIGAGGDGTGKTYFQRNILTNVVATGTVQIDIYPGGMVYAQDISLNSGASLNLWPHCYIEGYGICTAAAGSTLNFWGGGISNIGIWNIDPAVTFDYSYHSGLTPLFLRLPEISTPNAIRTLSSIYSKVDKKPYYQDTSGIENQIILDSDPRLTDNRTDATAIHEDVGSEILNIAEKATPTSLDLLLIEDNADLSNKKHIKIGNLPAATPAQHTLAGAQHAPDTLANLNTIISDATLIDTNDPRLSDNRTDLDAIHKASSSEISGVTEKLSPISTDVLLLEDSEASFVKKKIQIANLPAGVPAPHPLGGTQHTSDTLANVNSLISDATLIDTGDTRLSDDRVASGIRTATTVVVSNSAAAPAAGQALVASNGSSAAWQDIAHSVGALAPLSSSGGQNPSISLSGIVPILNGGTNSSAALTGNKAIVSNATSIIEHATTTATEVGYLAGVTSSIQAQIDSKEPLIGYTPANIAGDTFTGSVVFNSTVSISGETTFSDRIKKQVTGQVLAVNSTATIDTIPKASASGVITSIVLTKDGVTSDKRISTLFLVWDETLDIVSITEREEVGIGLTSNVTFSATVFGTDILIQATNVDLASTFTVKVNSVELV